MRYYSLNEYCRQTFGEKLYKLALDGGMTCPNRDGTLDTRGCIFCSGGGSGDFAQAPAASVAEQIALARSRIAGKTSARRFIAYFQSFTNTYAPLPRLEQLFSDAIACPEVAVLAIATRPDCLPPPVVELLARLNQIMPVWVELGLQTVCESTARYIRRGYPLPVFDDAVARLHAAGIQTVTHVILGLPGESLEHAAATVRHVAAQGCFGIKLQLLHVLKGTDLAADYAAGRFSVLSKDAYIRWVLHLIRLLPPQTVIHRLTGDGPKSLLIAPMWSANKKDVLNSLSREMERQNVFQGQLFRP
ncbi:MAG: TIGR01212 family radical SAM protein [Christensenellaceae bacterium]|nr:TIGR01212 family radical SAM protein [Christensenellaceae bacterium]